MDPSQDPHVEAESESEPQTPTTPRKLPLDLPTSLDDRRTFTSYDGEEMYDGWQGKDWSRAYCLLDSSND